MKVALFFPVSFIGICAIALCTCTPKTNKASFTQPLRDYLKVRGEICLGKPHWPIDILPNEIAAGSRDALQLPELARLGLVNEAELEAKPEGADTAASIPVKHYQLTEQGQQYYWSAEARTQASGGKARYSEGDMCVAKLDLDSVVDWQPTLKTNGRETALVHYTYTVDAAKWLDDDGVKREFPMMARILAGAQHMQMEENFVLTDTGWVARELAN